MESHFYYFRGIYHVQIKYILSWNELFWQKFSLKFNWQPKIFITTSLNVLDAPCMQCKMEQK